MYEKSEPMNGLSVGDVARIKKTVVKPYVAVPVVRGLLVNMRLSEAPGFQQSILRAVCCLGVTRRGGAPYESCRRSMAISLARCLAAGRFAGS